MKILDVCCGSKMFWYQKDRSDVLFMDIRKLEDVLCDGRKLSIKPDVIGDFRNIPYEDGAFDIVVFDPPHLIQAGKNSWLAKKYGVMNKDTFEDDIKQGFHECFRVLKEDGILVFKWNAEQVPLAKVLRLAEYQPVLGDKRNASKTYWIIFIKGRHEKK